MSDVAKVIKDFQREMRAEMRELRGEVQESMKFCSNTVDDLKEALAEIKNLTSEVKKSREQFATLKQENVHLTERLEAAESRISELEQYSRLNNVEIKGLPATVKDREDEMVMKIAEASRVPLEQSDIDIAHSVPNKNKDINVIVRFVTRTKRNAFLAATKKAKLTTSKIGFSGPEQNIYVNEHLTPENKRLLGAAISKKKEVSWKHVWSRNGNVLAQKTDDSKSMRIRSQADLMKMT